MDVKVCSGATVINLHAISFDEKMSNARYVKSPGALRIAPSILSADFSKLGAQIVEADEGGADMIHIDVMDGHFVPNLTIGPAVIQSIRTYTELPFDVHLMIDNPYEHVEKFVKAGSDIVTVHAEVKSDLVRCVKYLRDCGVGVGVSLNPSTPLSTIVDILPDIDLLLLMTVNPGFGGQDFMENVMPKLERAKQRVVEEGLELDIEVDGGVKQSTAGICRSSGADILVAGSAVFGGERTIAENISLIRKSALEG
jgi:ribulose-phosphate 3-epimerase